MGIHFERGKVPRGMCGSENEEGERRRKLHNGVADHFITAG
jgi:hypothetical protein